MPKAEPSPRYSWTTEARYWRVITTSVMPWRLSSSIMWTIAGRSTTGTIGLGRRIVSGRRREPSPPAMITAFTVASWREKTQVRNDRAGLRFMGHVLALGGGCRRYVAPD